mgnify:CR=1 FL=1
MNIAVLRMVYVLLSLKGVGDLLISIMKLSSNLYIEMYGTFRKALQELGKDAKWDL